MDLWVKLDNFWEKTDFICFQRLYLPFQKWGIYLICLHCATAMYITAIVTNIYTIYISLKLHIIFFRRYFYSTSRN